MDYRKTVEHLREKAEIFKKSNYAVDGIVKCFEESADTIEQLAEELKQFKDKQEQGLLIELPCKVGDCVYRFCGSKGRKYVDIRYVNNITYRLDYKGDVVWEIFTTTNDVLGKTVFLTRSEAEEALAKMGGK